METHKCLEAWFHNKAYTITLTSDTSSLAISIEEQMTSKVWQGEFSVSYIEKMTQKTSSFKRFCVFLKMLMSGLDRTSPSIHIDVLKGTEIASMRTSCSEKHNDKLYIIVTYTSEFEKVHYPLPLKPAGSQNMLQTVVQQLKKELDTSHKDAEIQRLTFMNEEMEKEIMRLRKFVEQMNIDQIREERDLYKKESEHYWNENKELKKNICKAKDRINTLEVEVKTLFERSKKKSNSSRTPNRLRTVDIGDIDNKLNKIYTLISNV